MSEPITDMVGQPVRRGSKVVISTSKGIATGRVVHVEHLFCTVQSDTGTYKWRRVAPWQLVVFGVEIRGKVELVA